LPNVCPTCPSQIKIAQLELILFSEIKIARKLKILLKYEKIEKILLIMYFLTLFLLMEKGKKC